jgi:hypothetical protein
MRKMRERERHLEEKQVRHLTKSNKNEMRSEKRELRKYRVRESR